jgi:hypothetical protein
MREARFTDAGRCSSNAPISSMRRGTAEAGGWRCHHRRRLLVYLDRLFDTGGQPQVDIDG